LKEFLGHTFGGDDDLDVAFIQWGKGQFEVRGKLPINDEEASFVFEKGRFEARFELHLPFWDWLVLYLHDRVYERALGRGNFLELVFFFFFLLFFFLFTRGLGAVWLGASFPFLDLRSNRS
jgi:hypothetical protein